MDSKCVCDTRLAIKRREHATKFMRNFNETQTDEAAHTHTHTNGEREREIERKHTHLSWPMNVPHVAWLHLKNGEHTKLQRARKRNEFPVSGREHWAGLGYTESVAGPAVGTGRLLRPAPCTLYPAWLPGAINAANACYQNFCAALCPLRPHDRDELLQKW